MTETKDTPEPKICAVCGGPATCLGQYDDRPKGYACDSCCGHGGEDGKCEPVVPTPEPSVTTDPQVLDRDAIHVGIVGALKSAVKAHGPLSGRQIGSAAKRVLGQVLATVESQRARDHRIAWETIQQLANKVAELEDTLTLERQQHRDALAAKDRDFEAVLRAVDAEREDWREENAAQAQEIADLKKCRHGHEWSNQFGDDWTPDDQMLCDCGAKTWVQRTTIEALRLRLTAVEQKLKAEITVMMQEVQDRAVAETHAKQASSPERASYSQGRRLATELFMYRLSDIVSALTPTSLQTPEDQK